MSNQSENNKRLVRNTLLLYMRMIVLMGISLYTSRVILSVLGVEDYGIYNVVGGFVSMFTVISASLTTAVTRFITFEMGKGNKERMNSVFFTSVNIEILLGILIVILAETVGIWFFKNKMVIPADRVDAAFIVYQLSVVTLFINLISIPYNASIVAHEKMSAFAYISIFEASWKLLICFLIPVIPLDHLVVYGLLMFAIAVFVRLLYQFYCTRHFEECKYRLRFDREVFRQMLGFAGWETIGSTAMVIRDQGGNILLNIFFGPAVNAARGVAMQVNNAIKGFVNNFMMALNPQITKSYARGEEEYFMQLVNRGARFSFFLMLFLSLPVLFNTEFILDVWLKEVPAHSVWFLRLVLLEVLVDTLSGTMRTAQNATGKNKIYQICIGGTNLFTIPICYVLLRIGLMPESIFIACVVINVFHLIIRIIILNKMIPYFSPSSFIKDVVVKALAVAVISALPLAVLYNLFDQGVIAFLLISTVSVIVSSVSILYIGCTPDERKTILDRVKKVVTRQS